MKESGYNVWVEHEGFTYVFNAISGGLLRLPHDDYQAFKDYLDGGPITACPTPMLEQLVRGRMLLLDDTDEVAMLSERYQAARHDKTHLGLTILTSLGCNFDCPYCYETKHPAVMKRDVQDAILHAVEQNLPNLKHLHVTWYGGEPLLGKAALLALSDRLIERCDRHGVEFVATIVTNGYLLDKPTSGALASRRVRAAQITLDGPPEIHDRMRPLANGSGTFRRIVENLHGAVEVMRVAIRVNVYMDNSGRVEELFRILQAEGLAGKLSVYPGQMIPKVGEETEPTCANHLNCYSTKAFAGVERAFYDLAARYGFGTRRLPSPTADACMAVRDHCIVVGSQGELYKCWESVGRPSESTGDIRTWGTQPDREAKWLAYDPFASAECRACTALPLCMGGCVHRALDPELSETRCRTVRHSLREQVLEYVRTVERDRVGD